MVLIGFVIEIEFVVDSEVVEELFSFNLIPRLSKPMYVDGPLKPFSNSIVTFRV